MNFFSKCALIIALSVTTASYPMAAVNPVTRQATKELLKKGIEKGTTALHWAIAAGPIWEPIISMLWTHKEFKKRLEFMKGTDDYAGFKEEQKWIREELKNQGFKNWDQVILWPGQKWAANSLLPMEPQYLIYPYRKINKMLAGERFEKLNVERGSVSHEKTHLEQYHPEQLAALRILMPFITHAAWNKIFTTSKFNNSFGLKNFFKMVTGWSKLQINLIGIWLLEYLHEKEADEGTIDDPIVLEAMAEHFNSREAKYKKHGLNEGMLLVDVHPHPLNRAKRFEERANELLTEQYKAGQLRTALLRASQQKI